MAGEKNFSGLVFVVGGFSLVFFPDLICRYLIGFFFALLGIGFIIMENKIVFPGK